jgi:hypothetical protein
MQQIHQGNKQLLELSLLGALFGMLAGASSGLMFGLMTGRSWERDLVLVLVLAGALIAGAAVFVPLYLHLMAKRG